MPLKLPIGIHDFRRLRQDGHVYVDKSPLVRDVVESGCKVLLLSRPRRFGRTLNLSMLRCFLDRGTSDARILFDGLALAREDEHVWQHANRYPVIALTCKDACSGTWDVTYSVLREAIRGLFAEHRGVLKGGKLAPRDESLFRRMLDGSAAPIDYALALLNLSRALHHHYGEQAMILIDEYDAPIHAAYLGGYLKEALDFLQIFLGAGLKENPHLHKGVLTGILRVVHDDIFSGLNNVAVYSVLSRDFRTAFGFTEPEVKRLLEAAGRLDSFDVVRRRHNGYIFGGEGVYEPSAVLNFVKHGTEPAIYGLNTGSNELVCELLVRHAPVVQPDLVTLLAGGSIERRPGDALVLNDLARDPNALWGLLLFFGYLKATRIPPLPDEEATYALSIPNLEVRQVYLKTFSDWLRATLQRRGGSPEGLLSALLEGDAPRLEAQLSALAMETLSYHDIAGPEPERFYQGLMIGLLASLLPTFEIRSNREAGKGRADMLFRPRRPGHPGVVLELKVARSGAGLKRALEQGMTQIRKMGYANELLSAGISPVRCVVVAFDGKSVRVMAEDAGAPAKKRPAPKRRAATTRTPDARTPKAKRRPPSRPRK